MDDRADLGVSQGLMPYARRDCKACGTPFVPPQSGGLIEEFKRFCPSCRRARKLAEEHEPFVVDAPPAKAETHSLLAPMRQCVFDLETFSLTRSWGVTMVASLLIHGLGPEPQFYTFDLRDFSTWPEKRSVDVGLVERVVGLLGQCEIAYAHNGERFDMRWLRSVCLKYGMAMPDIKLVDPCQVAWRKYRLDSNSLSSVANFLELDEEKMPVSQEVWRRALLDNSQADWDTLRQRCESDVRLLNAVASRVTKDIGMIDYTGSWR
jgi:RNase H-like protein